MEINRRFQLGQLGMLLLLPLWVVSAIVCLVVYTADETRRVVGLGPPVTTIEAQLIDQPIAEDNSQRRTRFLCIAKELTSEPDGCLYRSFPYDIFGLAGSAAEGTLDSGKWSFRISVDNAPGTICFIFYDRNPSSRLPAIGSMCLSGVPSPGVLRVSNIACSSRWPDGCKADDVVREAIGRTP